MLTRSNFGVSAAGILGNDVGVKPFLSSVKEKLMRKSVVLFILAIAVVLAFVLATPYYYSATPENRGVEPVTDTSQ